MSIFAVIGANEGSRTLVRGLCSYGVDARMMTPGDALEQLRAGDALLIRLDILPTLDGIEPGLDVVPALERRGVVVLNPRHALVAAHDKLVTALRLAHARLPHPRTRHLATAAEVLKLTPPVVLKPRLGSWGRDVWRCTNRLALRRRAAEMQDRRWFRRHGVLAQQLVPPRGYDLRLIVAGGTVVGAVRRVAARGEWRTNVSLGGSRRPCDPDAEACQPGAAAAAVIGCDLVGVDLLPTAKGWVVLELNAAVDFDDEYSLATHDIYRDIAAAFGLDVGVEPRPRLLAEPAGTWPPGREELHLEHFPSAGSVIAPMAQRRRRGRVRVTKGGRRDRD
jgi:RimK family alpha-L-glutamate ligase